MATGTIDGVRLDDDTESSFTPSPEWAISSGTNSRSFEEESWSYTKHKDYNLQFVKKKEAPPNYRMIPASNWERLAYFQCFVSSIGKTHIFCMQQINVNRFIWSHMFTVFLKNLPTAYRTIFLAAYSPEHHLYVSKMVPFFTGCSIQILIGGIVDLVMSCEVLILAMEFLIDGILNQAPWNKCGGMKFTNYGSYKVQCYNFNAFVKQCENKTVDFKKKFYYSVAGNGTIQYFQMAHMMYFNSRAKILTSPIAFNRYGIYCVAVWIFAAINYSQLFHKCIWKVLLKIHISLIIIYVTSYLYVVLTFIDTPIVRMATLKYIRDASQVISIVDFNFLCESHLTPPAVHVLTSRMPAEVHVGRDSLIMVASNSIFFLLREIFAYKLKAYCEMMAKFSISSSRLNRYPWFVFWPMFFSFFYFGNFMTIVFLLLLLTEDLLTFTITYQCLIEVIVREWRRVNRLMATIAVSLLGILIVVFTNTTQRIITYICVKGIVSLTETLVVNCLYPMERLLDDITFHYGTPPTAIIQWLLRFIPYFYTLKLYLMLLGIERLLQMLNYEFPYTRIVALVIPVIPVVCGMFYAVCKIMFRKKKDWKSLFRPIPQWGPRDHIARQMRKQYDSREFVYSQGSRFLSRHMIAKAAKMYKLDIHYEETGRHASVSGTHMRFESDKKQR